MAKKSKWEIEGLSFSKQLRKSANAILYSRINSLIRFAERYLRNPSVENLHDVRIAIRRVRYSMEAFLICFDRKIFLRFYNIIQKLQDLSGSVRDVDISLENLNYLIKENNLIIDEILVDRAESRKSELEKLFQLKLKKFLKGKALKDFYKQIF